MPILKTSNKNKATSAKNSNEKTFTTLKEIDSKKPLASAKIESSNEMLSNKTTLRPKLMESSVKNGSFVAKELDLISQEN